MSSPFKMKYGGASALLKTLVPESSPAKSYGKSPVKKDNKFVDVDVDKAESKEVKLSQLQIIMVHLVRNGSITSWQAITEYNITID